MRCAGNVGINVVDVFDGSSGRWSTAVLNFGGSNLAATSLPNQGLAIFSGGKPVCAGFPCLILQGAILL
jgi:hypothetical protein